MNAALPVIGMYPFQNIGAVLIHEVNFTEQTVTASINGKNPVHCGMAYEKTEDGRMEPGIQVPGIFVPFSKVKRMGT